MNSPEIYFAQHLAANDSKIRFRAFKKLKIWLTARSFAGKTITEPEMLKIWKGLHYCMWMCDKPLVQENLADKISNLIHCFDNKETAALFIDVFFQTISREWYGIDRFRLEKFMMLVRRFLHHTFQMLKQKKFKLSVVKLVLTALRKTVINPTDETVPNGLKYHIVDIYLDELGKVAGEELSPKQLRGFIRPYAEFLVQNSDAALCGAITKDVFHYLIWQARNEDEIDYPDDEKVFYKFNVDFKMLYKLLLKLASEEDVKTENRKRIYKLIRQYKDMANGTFPLERIKEDEVDFPSDIDEDDINKAAERLLKMENTDRKNNRHRNIHSKKLKYNR